LTRGTWTRHDRLQLLELSSAMSGEQFATLQQRVAQAVNQDKLALEAP
jgi:hypothetical protein